jgi:hypothetical protein
VGSSLRLGRHATRELTRVGLVLAPRRGSGRWLVRWAMLAIVLSAGAGLGYAARGELPAAAAPAPLGPSPEVLRLRREGEQARLALRLAEARGQELERQVDAVNERLREGTEELTFFRKAREGRR